MLAQHAAPSAERTPEHALATASVSRRVSGDEIGVSGDEIGGVSGDEIGGVSGDEIGVSSDEIGVSSDEIGGVSSRGGGGGGGGGEGGGGEGGVGGEGGGSGKVGKGEGSEGGEGGARSPPKTRWRAPQAEAPPGSASPAPSLTCERVYWICHLVSVRQLSKAPLQESSIEAEEVTEATGGRSSAAAPRPASIGGDASPSTTRGSGRDGTGVRALSRKRTEP
jgi:hypothetical protein